MNRSWLAAFGILAATAACGGATQPRAQQSPPVTVVRIGGGPTCPPPSPGPTPLPPVMLYPMPGASAVPTSAGEIVFAGAFDATYGPGHYTLTTALGAAVPIGTPTIAPAPLPSPIATEPPSYSQLNLPLQAVPLPALSPATTYAFGYVATGYDGNNPPVCTQQYSQQVGTFTTQ